MAVTTTVTVFWNKGKARSSKTSVFIYKTKLHHMPGDKHLQQTHHLVDGLPLTLLLCTVQCGFQFHRNLADLLCLKD